MDWVRNFYSTAAHWWGPAEGDIGDRDHRRVALVETHAGAGPHRVLDLGSGYGSTAVALAHAGHTVTGVEVSDAITMAERLPCPAGPGTVTFRQADFFEVELPDRFDVVGYWDGFGVGTDADQRRVLTRIAHDWLRPDGVALIDVFNPFVWAGWDGDLEHKSPNPDLGYAHELCEEVRFDPITCTAIDTWWPAADPDAKISQRLRCYTPADLSLLLAGTGLRLVAIGLDERMLPAGEPQPGLAALLRDRHDYLAVLRTDSSTYESGEPVP